MEGQDTDTHGPAADPVHPFVLTLKQVKDEHRCYDSCVFLFLYAVIFIQQYMNMDKSK